MKTKERRAIGIFIALIGVWLVSPVLTTGYYLTVPAMVQLTVLDSTTGIPIYGADVSMIGIYDSGYWYSLLLPSIGQSDADGIVGPFSISMSDTVMLYRAEAPNYVVGLLNITVPPGGETSTANPATGTFNMISSSSSTLEGNWKVNDATVVSGSAVRVAPGVEVTISFEEISTGTIDAKVTGAVNAHLERDIDTGIWSVSLGALPEGNHDLELVASSVNEENTAYIAVVIAKPGTIDPTRLYSGIVFIGVGAVGALAPKRKGEEK